MEVNGGELMMLNKRISKEGKTEGGRWRSGVSYPP